jgi:hypothetical protein
MAKIELAKLKSGARHTVKVTLAFEENGKSNTEQMRVVYRGVSLDEALDHAAKVAAAPEEAEKRHWLIEALVNTVLELPDLIDDGHAVPPTAEFFSTLDTYYLNRINQAIVDDRSGNG